MDGPCAPPQQPADADGRPATGVLGVPVVRPGVSTETRRRWALPIWPGWPPGFARRGGNLRPSGRWTGALSRSGTAGPRGQGGRDGAWQAVERGRKPWAEQARADGPRMNIPQSPCPLIARPTAPRSPNPGHYDPAIGGGATGLGPGRGAGYTRAACAACGAESHDFCQRAPRHAPPNCSMGGVRYLAQGNIAGARALHERPRSLHNAPTCATATVCHAVGPNFCGRRFYGVRPDLRCTTLAGSAGLEPHRMAERPLGRCSCCQRPAAYRLKAQRGILGRPVRRRPAGAGHCPGGGGRAAGQLLRNRRGAARGQVAVRSARACDLKAGSDAASRLAAWSMPPGLGRCAAPSGMVNPNGPAGQAHRRAQPGRAPVKWTRTSSPGDHADGAQHRRRPGCCVPWLGSSILAPPTPRATTWAANRISGTRWRLFWANPRATPGAAPRPKTSASVGWCLLVKPQDDLAATTIKGRS